MTQFKFLGNISFLLQYSICLKPSIVYSLQNISTRNPGKYKGTFLLFLGVVYVSFEYVTVVCYCY